MFMVTTEHTIWAIIPAAGSGKRMQADMPKQYLDLLNRPVLEHTLNRLLEVEHIAGAVIALQHCDPWWRGIRLNTAKQVHITLGGEERCHSVMNALHLLACQPGYDAATCQALVHDAVRPCVRAADIEKLIAAVDYSEHGGLLGMPVRDTMKRRDRQGAVMETVNRENLWHALTPQLFGCEVLSKALQRAIDDDYLVTDESSAMEHAGYHPLLVHGSEDNIKITRPGDLELAALYLRKMELE
jgi:2-C-methyl-D-erythritol 4-phosphate cytidylyltransferase